MDVTSYLLGKKSGGGGGEVNLQNNKEVTITSNTTTVINPDEDYDGMKKVTVTTNVAPDLSDYFMSTIPADNSYAFQKAIVGIPNLPISGTNLKSAFANLTNLTTVPLLDTSNVTDMNSMFQSCTSLTTIPLLDTSKVTDMTNMFSYCTSLTSIPLLDTSSVSSRYMNNMFYNCTSLTTVPILNTSKLTQLTDMFKNCPNLTDTSLDNILQMCINSMTGATSYKKLSIVGFTATDYPVSRIQALPHYQDFINAGWTIGY